MDEESQFATVVCGWLEVGSESLLQIEASYESHEAGSESGDDDKARYESGDDGEAGSESQDIAIKGSESRDGAMAGSESHICKGS